MAGLNSIGAYPFIRRGDFLEEDASLASRFLLAPYLLNNRVRNWLPGLFFPFLVLIQ